MLKKSLYIWEEVLRCDEITIDDNMYELGSNSLKVASIVSRIQKTMDVKIPLSEMFQLTTIRKQAEYIRGASKSKYEKIYPVSEKNYYETSSVEKRMYKYTGQEDIVVGIPIAGRMHEDVENVVGMFVNTLAMRNYPVGNKTFNDFLMELKENSIKAYENQEYQFEELLTKINVTRDVNSIIK